MTYDICCIGHITLDKIVTPRHTVYMPGGTAFYFSHALACLEHDSYLLLTALGETEMGSVEDMRGRGLHVKALPSRASVYFENVYGQNQNDRKQRVLAKADPFSIEGLEGVDSRIYHLGTLLADDFSPEVIRGWAERLMVSVDAQGFLREVRGEKVYPCDWEGKEELLPYIDILKANEHEMVSLTGHDDPLAAARRLADWGVKEVVLTLGDRGSLIYTGGEAHVIPAYPVDDVVDATGCGDTYMAGYLYIRSRGGDVDEAGRFASAMCSLKLAHSGPFDATESQVRSLMTR